MKIKQYVKGRLEAIEKNPDKRLRWLMAGGTDQWVNSRYIFKRNAHTILK